MLEHLGHERHAVELALLVEGPEDLRRDPNLNDVAGSQRTWVIGRHAALMMRAAAVSVNSTIG